MARRHVYNDALLVRVFVERASALRARAAAAAAPAPPALLARSSLATITKLEHK
jgi:hypothetical protein